MPGAAKKRKSSPSSKSKGVTKKRKISRKSEFIDPNSSKPEIKFIDAVADNEPLYNQTTIVSVPNNVLVGTGNFNRIGNKITMKGIEYQIAVYRTAVGVTNTFPTTMRWAIVYDREPSPATTAVWTDVFLSQDTSGNSNSNLFLNRPNSSEKSRFLILHDEMISLPQVDANAIGPAGFMAWDSAQPMHRKGYIKLSGLTSMWNNAAAQTQGSILVFALCNNSTVTNNATCPYGVQYSFRTSYTDN